MAARRKTTRAGKTTRARVKAARTQAKRTMDRIESELPPTLAQFSRDVRSRLGRLEKEIVAAEARTRRNLTRLLRDASHQLGRIEAQGQRRWRKLTTQARRDAVRTLRRLEKAVAPPKRKAGRKKATRKRVS
jgi:hypothetical protein